MPRHSTVTEWTDEQRQAIADAFLKDGESASVIGKRYGVSRNAILGLVHRYKSAHGIGGKTRAAAPRSVAAKQPVSRPASRGTRPSHIPPIPRKTRLPQIDRCTPAPARLVAIADLKSGECRFPVTPHDAPRDGHLFCGLGVAEQGGSYCAAHVRLAHA